MKIAEKKIKCLEIAASIVNNAVQSSNYGCEFRTVVNKALTAVNLADDFYEYIDTGKKPSRLAEVRQIACACQNKYNGGK